MARQIGRLSALAVNRVTSRGYLADGGGLYLQISASGAKSWVFRYRDAGRLREMGLGPLHTLSLSEARDAAHTCRKQRLAGIDPIGARKATRLAARLEAARSITFRECAEAYIEAHKGGWKNLKHAAQWPSTLQTYAYPVIGDLPVQGVDVRLVMDVLEPIWSAKTETASRLRGRIEAVLDWATVRGYRQGENPARWRGHLDHLLPERSKIAKVVHHPALPYAEIGAFMEAVRQQPGIASVALRFTILTAARTSEVIGATWSEIDVENAAWIVPAHRIKAGREHRVPLSAPAMAILRSLYEVRQGQFVFPGRNPTKPLSNMALLALLRRMNRDDLTAHGFRSTFRDWAAEQTSYPREVAEHALAHALPDKVEAAYRRSDLFGKRSRLMGEWAAFCAGPTNTHPNVLPIRSAV